MYVCIIESLVSTFISKKTTDLESSPCVSALLDPADLVPDIVKTMQTLCGESKVHEQHLEYARPPINHQILIMLMRKWLTM